MSQASLFQYYSVCKRKVDEPFKKDKEQQQPQSVVASAASVKATVDLQLPRSKLSAESTSSSSSSQQSSSTADRALSYVGKDENTHGRIEPEAASPFKVPTTPVPRRSVGSAGRIRKSASKSSGAGSRTGTPDRQQESILKWAKRRQPEEMSAGSASPLRLSDRLNESNQKDVANESSTIDTPKRKKQQPESDDLIASGTLITSPSSVKSSSSSSRHLVRCALIEPLRAAKLEQEKQIEALIKCNEKSIESARPASDEKLELIGVGSNLAALRQRMRKNLNTDGSPRKVPQRIDFGAEPTGSQTAVTPTKSTLDSPSKDQLVRERKLAFGKCSNLTELREKLAGSDRTFLDKIKQFERSASSPVKLNVSALNPASPSKRLTEMGSPAARRTLTLSSSESPKKLLEQVYSNSPIKGRPDSRASISTDGLNLPLKYKQLIDSFYCLDSVVSMIFNRQETCTFDKVRFGVQKITKKNFDIRQFAQMMFVYSTSYECKWEKRLAVENGHTAPGADLPGRVGQFVLILRPCVPNVKMTPSVLKVRKTQFEEKLLDFAKKEHQKYLLSLIPPIEISPELLRKWHPSFKFPEVLEAKLPEVPSSTCLATPNSITEFWNKTNSISTEAPVEQAPEQTQKEANREKITKGPLRGLSMGFLEKVI
jgi:hypothetical protein